MRCFEDLIQSTHGCPGSKRRIGDRLHRSFNKGQVTRTGEQVIEGFDQLLDTNTRINSQALKLRAQCANVGWLASSSLNGKAQTPECALGIKRAPDKHPKADAAAEPRQHPETLLELREHTAERLEATFSSLAHGA